VQRRVWRVKEPKRTCACSARARTRGQNPQVYLYADRVINRYKYSALEIHVVLTFFADYSRIDSYTLTHIFKLIPLYCTHMQWICQYKRIFSG
jgi:hypothetical protein